MDAVPVLSASLSPSLDSPSSSSPWATPLVGNWGTPGGLKGAEERDDNLKDAVDAPKTNPAEPALVVIEELLSVFVEAGRDCASRLAMKFPLGVESTFVVDGGFESVLKVSNGPSLGAFFSVKVSAVAPGGCVLGPNWKGDELLLPPRDPKLVIVMAEKVGRLANTELEVAAVATTVVVDVSPGFGGG